MSSNALEFQSQYVAEAMATATAYLSRPLPKESFVAPPDRTYIAGKWHLIVWSLESWRNR